MSALLVLTTCSSAAVADIPVDLRTLCLALPKKRMSDWLVLLIAARQLCLLEHRKGPQLVRHHFAWGHLLCLECLQHSPVKVFPLATG